MEGKNEKYLQLLMEEVGTQTSKLFFFFVELGFALGKQVVYHLSHTLRPFCSGYFGDEF
jgi:hypothetical protein